MVKTSIVCSEGSYSFHLQWFNEHNRVITLYGHKIYCKLKVMNHYINTEQKCLPEKLSISSFNGII